MDTIPRCYILYLTLLRWFTAWPTETLLLVEQQQPVSSLRGRRLQKINLWNDPQRKDQKARPSKTHPCILVVALLCCHWSPLPATFSFPVQTCYNKPSPVLSAAFVALPLSLFPPLPPWELRLTMHNRISGPGSFLFSLMHVLRDVPLERHFSISLKNLSVGH